MKRYLLWAMLALGALAVVLLPGPAAAQHSNGARDQGNSTARSVFELIAAINAANQAGGSNTINLPPDHPGQRRNDRAEHGPGHARVPPVRRGARGGPDPR
jgi:hypothetical protein